MKTVLKFLGNRVLDVLILILTCVLFQGAQAGLRKVFSESQDTTRVESETTPKTEQRAPEKGVAPVDRVRGGVKEQGSKNTPERPRLQTRKEFGTAA